MANGGQKVIPSSRGLPWQYEPLVVHVYGKYQTTPSIHLRLAPVFFNPLCLSGGEWFQEENVVEEIEQRNGNSTENPTTSKAVDSRWRVDSVEHYLQPKKKRVVSAYMDNHKITSLLRTFEIMSRHQEECGVPVTISWEPPTGLSGSTSDGGGVGGYVGIVSGRGDVDISRNFPIGMVKIVVDQVHNIAMLRSSTLDCYLTGHTDSGVVDGRADSSDVTACHWKVIPCEKIFQDPRLKERGCGIVLQFWSKKHSKDRVENGLFLVIKRGKEFRLESFSFLRECGVFRFN